MKQVIKYTSKLGELFNSRLISAGVRNRNQARQFGLPDIHGDFRPDLKQDFDLVDVHVPLYVDRNHII